MTPASPILHFLAEIQRDLGIIVFQPESELAAINMAIGAAYAGRLTTLDAHYWLARAGNRV
jgi:2-oxoglutarate ferredoxin oxidoreductase subunit alpha